MLSKLKLLLTVFFLMLFNFSKAQMVLSTDTANVSQPSQVLPIMMTTIAIIFVLVIWGLSHILFAMAKLVSEKEKNISGLKAGMTVLLMLFMGHLYAEPSAAQTSSDVIWGMNSTLFYALAMVIIIELFAIAFLSFLIRRLYSELIPEKKKEAAVSIKLLRWWENFERRNLTKAIPVEKEADALLNHDYDGIRELDNALPPWWKYGFYVTIVIGVIYLFNFHVMGYGKSPTQEYEAEIIQAQIDKENYEAANKDKIDENNVPMADAKGIARGNEIYHSPGMCSSCHGQLGEGGAGPNLTDDYWIHKGSLNDIYKSIKVGYPDKGMQSWEKSFSPKEIGYLASYIKSLKGTNPPGAQPPKGDLYIDNAVDSNTVSMKTNF